MRIPRASGRMLREWLRQREFGRWSVIGVVVVVACLSYGLGTYRAGQLGVLYSAEKAGTSGQSNECLEQLEQCRQQAVNLSKGAEIDAAVLAQTRSEVAQGHARMAKLEQDVTLYRSLVEGSVRTGGVSVHSLEIARVAGEQGQRYRYRLTFIQRAQRQVEVQGLALISVTGTRNGKEFSFGLPGPDGPKSGNRVPLRFVYFQTLEGDFSLPEGFEPLQVHVRAEIRKGKPQKAQRSFDWIVVED